MLRPAGSSEGRAPERLRWGDCKLSYPPSPGMQSQASFLPSSPAQAPGTWLFMEGEGSLSSGKPPQPGRSCCSPPVCAALGGWPQTRHPTSAQAWAASGGGECRPSLAHTVPALHLAGSLSSAVLEAGLALPPAEPPPSALGWGPQGLRMKLSSPPHWPLSCFLVVSWGWDWWGRQRSQVLRPTPHGSGG